MYLSHCTQHRLPIISRKRFAKHGVPAADEKDQYLLLGKATHPIAESHLLLSCQARTHFSKKIVVPNVLPKKEITYKVFSDLDCMGGKESVVVPAQTTAGAIPGAYTMHILAPQPGVFHGSITFMADSGKLSTWHKNARACRRVFACSHFVLAFHYFQVKSYSASSWC